MTFLHSNKRPGGFSDYIEPMKQSLKNLFFANLITLGTFLPLAIGVVLSILSSSVLLLIPSCLIGGILAGPGLSCLYDAILRCLRDASRNWWTDYQRAWKQNWRQAILPGILFCLMLGFYIFMAMLFWWSNRFPGWGTIAVYFCSLFLFTMLFSICWPQVALFDQSLGQCFQNSLLFMLRFFPKVAAISLLQIAYWIIMVLFLPWSVLLLPVTGIWLIVYTANYIIYDTMNDAFEIEDKIAEAFPEQIPFYEDDEAWLKRKQEEAYEARHKDR